MSTWAQALHPGRSITAADSACKVWSADPSLTLAVLAFKQKITDPDAATYDVDVLVAKSDTGEVLARFKRVLVAEMNDGQLVKVLRAEFGREIDGYAITQGRPLLAAEMERELLNRRLIKPGDVLGVVAGTRQSSGSTNFMRLHSVTREEATGAVVAKRQRGRASNGKAPKKL